MAVALLTHEEATIRAFIQKNRQERSLYLLADPKRRSDFTRKLAHRAWLDMRFANPIAASTAHSVSEIASLLRKKGASGKVWVISEDRRIDGQEMELEEAVSHTRGNWRATILSCIPGKLGLFRDEEGHCLLER
jgi:hypothetical protein